LVAKTYGYSDASVIVVKSSTGRYGRLAKVAAALAWPEGMTLSV
jgi:hypothetical protein